MFHLNFSVLVLVELVFIHNFLLYCCSSGSYFLISGHCIEPMIFITSFEIHFLALMFYPRFGLFNIVFRYVSQNFCAKWLNHRTYIGTLLESQILCICLDFKRCSFLGQYVFGGVSENIGLSYFVKTFLYSFSKICT